MNGEGYKKVLEDHLLPFMRIRRMAFFLQDGAFCLKSKMVVTYSSNQRRSSASSTGCGTRQT
jgi:hypothetical protein